MRQVVLISGRMCTGKSGLGRRLRDEFGYYLIRTSDLLKKAASRGGRGDRTTLQKIASRLDEKTRSRWVLLEVKRVSKTLPRLTPIVVDNIQTDAQLKHFRRVHAWQIAHAHLYAPREELERRFKKKSRKKAKGRSKAVKVKFLEVDHLKDEKDILSFKHDADVRINTARTDGRDTLVRVAARLGLYPPPDVRFVDVVVGGQFGSEGKGHVAAYLAKEYDVLVRVGGPNAGHTVSSASGVYTYHQLPSGTRDSKAIVLLGPGMTINVKRLLEEIRECRIGADRLFIDPQAMIIDENDIRSERDLVAKIASTGQGSGAAAARRILERKPKAVRLARDIRALRPYVGPGPNYHGSTLAQLELAYRSRKFVLLEGTQGSGLSLYHGQYPFVTSRDTNVAGCLAEAGISPARVRRILMVVRPTPIRVGNPDGGKGLHSGLLKHETDFVTIAKLAGLDPKEVPENERTSTTRRPRRVGWFDWEQFRRACALNAPTDLVLTFADYLHVSNQHARRFEQLHEDTIKFIEELERVAQAPVSLVNTRFPRKAEEKIDLRTVIDRRNWSTINHLE